METVEKRDKEVAGQRIYYSLIFEDNEYSISVESENGEREFVSRVLGDKKEAQELLQVLCHNEVTPVSVRDVITDYIDERDFISWHLRWGKDGK